ncbi:hypothetical protein GLOTRDRAFT_29445, partial [Gloeophyllum trabeum ATCC 11539]
FVYGLLLTEKHVRLYQFDRAGAVFSGRVPIHNEATTFVKLILALSTVDEVQLGFNDRIRWKNNDLYCIMDGVGTYKICNVKPFHRRTIRGRGTTCWVVEDPDEQGSRLLLKFAWRTLDRVPEWEFLEEIQRKCGRIPGVSELRGRGEIERISDLRNGAPLLTPTNKTINDRQYYYVFQPFYGRTLEKAPNTLILLEAFRDIIAAQWELARLDIVHRDISTQNMLLNERPDAQVGERGVLIDFDMAKRVIRDKSGAETDFRTGTRVFQSIKVLMGYGTHDYLDDLESSFYGITWIACTSDR